MKAVRIDAYNLLHQGILALGRAEAHGIRIDLEHCRTQDALLTRQIDRLEGRIQSSAEARKWVRSLGERCNPASNTKLLAFLHGEGHHVESVDFEALSRIDNPFIKDVLRQRKLIKTRDTYIRGLMNECDDHGIIHPFFNLHRAVTYRSSSDSPNFQNYPIRDPIQGKTVRLSMIPRDGNCLMEFDFSGAEVRVAACYHRDPNMISYIKDPTKDMHRDVAMDCYRLLQDDITKKIRHAGKNKFTFAEFYGSYFKQVAPDLWTAAQALRTPDGRLISEHLADLGISSYARFEQHIKQVEEHFWNVRFPVYNQWRKDWFKSYCEQGYFDTLTGFRCQGVMGRNDAINYPVQGSSFHCLLWTFIQMDREIINRRLKSRMVGQIHDSIVFDAVPAEAPILYRLMKEIVEERMPEHFTWMVVPMLFEAEATPINHSWFDKAPYEGGEILAA